MSTASNRAPRWRSVAVVGALTGLLATLLVATPASTAAANSSRFMSGWLPYWTTAQSIARFQENAHLFSDVSPFWFDAKASSSHASKVNITTNWLPESTSSLMAKLRGRGALILPSITDGTPAGHMASVMKNSTQRRALVQQIRQLVVSNNFDGIDLDFERFAFHDGRSTWSSTRPAWVTFTREMGAELRKHGKKLAVAVPPMYNSKRDATSGYWVYDYAGMAPHIDLLRIMAYDYSYSSPGPIGGPLSWARAVADYAKSQVPAHKVQLGTPTYGRDWVVSRSGSGCPKLDSWRTLHSSALGTAAGGRPASAWARDAASKERNISYTETYNSGRCTVARQAWLPDEVTVVERAKLARSAGIKGIATWMVGSERPGQWPMLTQLAGSSSPTKATQTVSVLQAPSQVRAGEKFVVRAQVQPARQAQMRILKRTIGPKGKSRWKVLPKKAKVAKPNGRVAVKFRIKKPGRTIAVRIVSRPDPQYKKGRIAVRVRS